LKPAFALLAVSVLASAATPVASLSSSSDFQLSGAAVNTAGVSSWPILAGDKIVSGVGAAIIRFTDGTVVTLAPASQAKVERDKDSISVRLLSGFMSFVAAPDSLLHFYYGNTAIKAQAGVSTTAGSSGSSPVLNRSVDPPPPPPTLSGH